MSEIGTLKPAALDLDALGIYNNKSIKSTGKAKIVVVGRPKIGKTTALSTAPSPLILNADGPDATLGAATHSSSDFLVYDVRSPKTFEKGLDIAEKLVKSGQIQSVILDTLTLLADNVLDILKTQGFQGFDLWREFDVVMRQGVKRLVNMDAHIFLSCHLVVDQECNEGIVPLNPGSGRRKIMALFNDIVLLSMDKDKRNFVLGPQGEWRGDGRNIKKSCVIEATVPALLKELCINP